MPDLANNSHFVEEFAFIQFSEDFDQVQYGTQEEIEQRKQQRRQMAQEEEDLPMTEEEKAEIEQLKATEAAKAEKKAEKNRKRKEKKKEMAKAEKEQSKQVNAQVKSELSDLMANFSMGGPSTTATQDSSKTDQ